MPSVTLLERIVHPVGFSLAALDPAGLPVTSERGLPRLDRAGRRFPAHLIGWPVGPRGEGWWGQGTVQDYIRPMPTWTFCRHRSQPADVD